QRIVIPGTISLQRSTASESIRSGQIDYPRPDFPKSSRFKSLGWRPWSAVACCALCDHGTSKEPPGTGRRIRETVCLVTDFAFLWVTACRSIPVDSAFEGYIFVSISQEAL